MKEQLEANKEQRPTDVASGAVLGAWVDVNERRPEKMGYVICACEGGNVDKSFYIR